MYLGKEFVVRKCLMFTTMSPTLFREGNKRTEDRRLRTGHGCQQRTEWTVLLNVDINSNSQGFKIKLTAQSDGFLDHMLSVNRDSDGIKSKPLTTGLLTGELLKLYRRQFPGCPGTLTLF